MGDPARIQPLSRSAWPTANHLPRRPSPSRPSAGPARPAPASRARLQPRADDAPSWTWRATTPTPAIPAVRLPAPSPHPATSFPSDTADVGTHGRRGPDTGQLDAQTPAPDTGRVDRPPWTPDARTGHWTPDAGHERGHGDDTTAGIRTLLGRHAERPHAETPTRVVPSHHQPAARPLRRPSGASAHCSPRMNFGSSVERTATLHPLCSGVPSMVAGLGRFVAGSVVCEAGRLMDQC
jgi:hypothetical protein